MARLVDAIAWVAINTEPGSDSEVACVEMTASLWRKNVMLISHDVDRYRVEMPRSFSRFTPSYNPTAL